MKVRMIDQGPAARMQHAHETQLRFGRLDAMVGGRSYTTPIYYGAPGARPSETGIWGSRSSPLRKKCRLSRGLACKEAGILTEVVGEGF